MHPVNYTLIGATIALTFCIALVFISCEVTITYPKTHSAEIESGIRLGHNYR